MGHHVDAEGRFQSDKYPDLPPDKLALSFHDPIAQPLLRMYAMATPDEELSGDILDRLDEIEGF